MAKKTKRSKKAAKKTTRRTAKRVLKRPALRKAAKRVVKPRVARRERPTAKSVASSLDELVADLSGRRDKRAAQQMESPALEGAIDKLREARRMVEAACSAFDLADA